jgi:hypothetical protein
MSSTIVAVSARRSGTPLLITNILTGSSNLRTRSSGEPSCNSGLKAILKNRP